MAPAGPRRPRQPSTTVTSAGRAKEVWDGFLEAVSAAYSGEIVMLDISCVCARQHGAAVKRGATTMAA